MIDISAVSGLAGLHRRGTGRAATGTRREAVPARSAAALLAGASFVAASALGAVGAAAQSADAPAPAGRTVIAELPPMPTGPVCTKDRDWIVVEAEQYIARTTARAEDLSKKVIEQELAADRDAAAARAVETTRSDLRETLRRVRDAQGYREDARRLATRDCLMREGQGPDLKAAAASVAGAATSVAPQMVEPMIDVRLSQAAACSRGAECDITLVSETRRPATDDRRVAVLIDLPSSTGTFVRSGDAWNCYATGGGAVCLAKLAQLKPGAPIQSKLTWRLQGGAGDGDARFCTRTVRGQADGRPTTDPDRMRLLQAVLADYGYRTGAIDGRFADGTRVVLASAAPDFGIERTGDDDHIAAALLGSMVSRVGVTTGPCLQLALAGPGAATKSDAPPLAVPVATAPAAPPETPQAVRPAGPPRPADAATTTAPSAPPAAKARKSIATLGEEPAPPAPAKAKVQPVKEKPLAVKVKPVRPEPQPVAEEPETVVVIKKPKRRVVVEGAPPVYVQPQPQPQVVAPPISIGIGLGRRGFGIGF